jgi:hypothetical protein
MGMFEFDCLLEYVDYVGFHSRFNHGASNSSPQEQAKYAKRMVDFHKECTRDRIKRELYFRGVARMAVADRQVFEWRCATFKAEGKYPSKRASREKRNTIKTNLKRDPALQLAIPDGCNARIKAMHAAVVEKLTEFLADIVRTGEVPIAVQMSGAPSTNFPVE